MEDFIVIYTYPYKGFFEENSEKYKIDSEEVLCYALAKMLENIEASMKFSGIDCKRIEQEVENIKGSSISETLGKLKLKSISSEEKKELREVAETYALYYALKIHSLYAFPKSDELKDELKLKVKASPFSRKKGIGIMLRFRDWIVIKKLSYEDVEDYMVAGIISGISSSIASKFYELLGFEAPKKKAKSLKNLAKDLEAIDEKGLNKNYQIYKAIIENGYKPFATLEMLAKEYPSLKAKKPRGRIPKG